MKKLNIIACSLLASATLTAAPRGDLRLPMSVASGDFSSIVGSDSRRSVLPATPRYRCNTFAAPFASRVKRAIAPVATTPAASYYNTLLGPDGSVWYTVGNITEDSMGSVSHFEFSIYDSAFNLIGGVEDDVTYNPELGETRVVQVDVVPQVTQKFFNFNANYEVMIYVVKNHEDYSIGEQTLVYEVGGATGPIATYEGNCVSAINASTDSWSENFYVTFMTPGYNFDIYSKATYGSGPKVIGTLEVPSDLLSGENAIPMLSVVHNGTPYFCISHLEKPYFEDAADFNNDRLNPDNNLIIELYAYEGGYAKQFVKKNTTTIACPNPTTMAEPFKMYYVGNFRYDDDLTFGIYNDNAAEPCYIITSAEYTPSSDSYIYDYYVCDAEGQTVATIGEDVEYGVFLQDIPGEQPQVLFIRYDNATESYTFELVDYVSCQTAVTLPQILDGQSLSTDFDRVAFGDSYLYICSVNYADYDAENNAIHSILFINPDGSIHHIDRINLGQNVAMAQPWLEGSFVNPYVFDTDAAQEYAFLIKRFTGQSSRTVEECSIVSNEGKTLVTFGPSPENGDLSQVIFITNPTNRKMWITWNRDWEFTTELFDLPLAWLSKGGDGTAENPYLISTMGDFQQIARDPGACYRLANDIDASGFQLVQIEEFGGTLDGDGHVISNLSLPCNGIFGSIVDKGSVSNLWFYDVTLGSAARGDASLLTSYAVGASFDGIHVVGLNASSPDGDGTVASLVGSLYVGSKMTACSVADAHIDCPASSVGGLVGNTSTGSVIDACAFSGTIKGAYEVGGIVASIGNADDAVTNCHVNASIVASSTVGGIVGTSARGKVANCIVEGSIAANGPGRYKWADFGPCAGGIVGELDADWTQEAGTAVDPIIYNNVVDCTLTGYTSETEPAYPEQRTTLHAIVGRSAINQEPDSDKPAIPEQALAANYTTTAAPDGATGGADTVDGAFLTFGELSPEFLATIGFLYGTTVDAPWCRVDGSLPILWIERGELLVSADAIEIAPDTEATLQVTILGAYGLTSEDLYYLDYSIDSDLFEITDIQADGHVVTFTIMALDPGTATLNLNWRGLEATVALTCNASGIDTIGADDAAATGPVRYYNLQGVEVQHPSGGVYIRVQGKHADKILIRN